MKPSPIAIAVAGAVLILLLFFFLFFFLLRGPAATDGRENGIFANDCCGTLVLRNGRMILNDQQSVRYAVGQDVRGPYILPRTYVGVVEDIGFAVDGTQSMIKLRLDRLPRPTRILVYAGLRPFPFERKEPRRPAGH